MKAVHSYLNGEESLREIAVKHSLSSKMLLRKWIKTYIITAKDSNSIKCQKKSRMTTSRKTTEEKNTQIIKKCLVNDCNYGEAAIKYKAYIK